MTNRLWPLLSVAVGFAILAGCASSVPNVEDALATPGVANPKPAVVSGRGPLSASESKAILDRLKREGKDTDILERYLALDGQFTDSPLTSGNNVTLLRDGEATFAAMFQAIRQAKNHVNLEYFIFEDIDSGGQHIVDLLIEKQKAGVRVNLIYDSLGSLNTPNALFDRLKQTGINVAVFNSIDPLAAGKPGYAPNSRDHRKILVVDGTTALVGGVNMSTVYASNPLTRDASKPGNTSDHWRDTDLRIEGPAVAELQHLFVATWTDQKGPPLNQDGFFPKVSSRGKQVVRIVGSSPSKRLPLQYVTLLSAIRNAEKRIWLTAGYFVPPEQATKDLQDAARRGVDVRLLLPSKSDSTEALNAGRSHYADLLEAGVKIYEIQDVVLHSKSTVIDGVWSSVGSSNFDPRSVVLNNEVDATVLGREVGQQLEAMFEEDLRTARNIDRKAWAERPATEKIRETASRIWGDWL
jgi:cardiolipin synthase